MFRLSLCNLWVGLPQSQIELQLHFAPPPIKSPKSECEDFFCGLSHPQLKFLATSMRVVIAKPAWQPTYCFPLVLINALYMSGNTFLPQK